MKAVLLSAGFGTRLRPITNSTPKCLVKINGRPLLDIWLESLTNAGITDILINSHYLAEQVEQFVRHSVYKDRVTLVHEPDLLGTLGTLKANKNFWRGENVLVAHADNLCLCDWQLFFQRFINRPASCIGTMMLFDTDTPSSCGIVELDKHLRVTAFHEKVDNPPSNLANAAVYLFDDSLLSIIEPLQENESDISLDLIPKLVNKLNIWKTTGYLRDIGTIESLKIASQEVLTLEKPF